MFINTYIVVHFNQILQNNNINNIYASGINIYIFKSKNFSAISSF